MYLLHKIKRCGLTLRSLLNDQLLERQALLYDLVPLTETDRDVMVEKMEDNISERGRVQQELQRISTKSNEVMFKSPLMLKNIIQLVIERKVDVNNLKCPSEVYLMLAMKNLDFQKDEITNFLELDPPEDQDYLMMCMMICQQKIQESEVGGSINTIDGIQRNVKVKGLCFEKTVFKERIQIPIAFIKKLGFFDIRKKDSKIFLDIVHLSYMEFCCAGSLCRDGVNIEEELSKIKDADRYEAVTTYMAGLFSQNPTIEFLTTVRHIAENFLLLLGNEKRDACIQTVFRSILKWSPEYVYKLPDRRSSTLILSIPEEGEFTLHGSRHTQLLVEALKASSDRISPHPTIKEIIFADNTKDRAELEIMTQLLVSSMENHGVNIGRLVCETKSDFKIICSLLSSSSLQSWTIDDLDLMRTQIQKMRFVKGEVIQLTIGCWIVGMPDYQKLSPLIDCLSYHSVEEIQIEKIDFWGESSLDSLTSLLSIPTLQSWTIDELKITYIGNPWHNLAKTAGQGSIKSLTAKSTPSHLESIQNWVKEEVEAVKISIAFLHFDFDVHCKTAEEMKTLCTGLGIAQEWRVDRLHLGNRIGGEGWEALSKVAGKGKVNTVTVSKSVLRAAKDQQVEVLWRATDGWWLGYDGESIIAKKSKGDAGLKKLLAHKSGRSCQIL